MRRCTLFVLSFFYAWGQLADLRPETTLLAEAREKMLYLLANQTNYTCLETVERTRQVPGGGARVEDTLRLEVALVDGRELFAWPGAKRFEDGDIREVVSTGMFGNGNYGIYTRMLFNDRGPQFEYRGPVTLFGMQLARYDFRERAERSGYHLRVGEDDAVTGFHGSIYLDANADLRRLEMVADDIPAVLGLTSAEDRVDYARTKIGDEDSLLPIESELQMASKDALSRNRVRFSGCRKFAGESSLIFEDVDVDAGPAVVAIQEVELPVDVAMTLEITSDLRLDRAAVGDVVTATLRSDVKRGKEKVILKGAVAQGRVVMLERTTGTYALSLQFQDLEWKGGHASIRAKFEGVAGVVQAGRSRIVVVPGGPMYVPAGSRAMKGETLYFRTVR